MMEWWYLSFADATRPEGEQWLGACYVRATGFVAAVDQAHLLGINPGGEVGGFGPLAQEAMDANTVPADRERLLSKEDLGKSVTLAELENGV